MKFFAAILCAVFPALSIAEWDKYAEERALNEPAAMDAEWEMSHGGPATKYTASTDWSVDDVTSAVKQATEAISTVLPSPQPTLAVDIDFDDPAWAKEQGYTPLDKREESEDIDSLEWAQENGYLPLERRDEPTIDAEDDIYNEAWATENGYAPLDKRAEADDPDSDEFAIANGYLPLSKREVDSDPDSDKFAVANGYEPLSKRGDISATKTARSALYNWVLSFGRRGRPTHYRD